MYQFGKRLQHIKVRDDAVTVSFDDGTQAKGSMIIGADGSHSKVREFLVGSEAAAPESLNLTMVNCIGTGYTPEQAKLLRSYHPIVKLSLHPEMPGGALLAGELDYTLAWKWK
jgi:2-polyprenyl-6-methoxyphenol hydroxylase-like FAD-dependent oxidoreductase